VLEVFLVRQLPIASALITLYLGTTRVRHVCFLVGSFLGFLPAATVFTLLGSGLMAESLAVMLVRIWGAFGLLAVAGWGSVRLSKRIGKGSGISLRRRPEP
jgi:uncharacterized membrane protein YdjX (TVP38/TMEM64 family)